jgi:hypothetical protein
MAYDMIMVLTILKRGGMMTGINMVYDNDIVRFSIWSEVKSAILYTTYIHLFYYKIYIIILKRTQLVATIYFR